MHFAGDVNVEAGDLAGDRVAEAEQVAADVESDDQPAARADVGHRGVGLGLGGKGAQAGGGIAVLARTVRRQRGLRWHDLHATGVGSGSVGVASTPSVSEWPQLASTIAKASGASGAAARARRARRVITDTLSAGATGRARRQWRHLS